MTLSTQPYKGTRDFYPEDLAKRNYIFNTWRKVLIASGFVEYDCSILESAEMYLAKSGEELGSKQLYAFEDKGERKIALRPEMTPSLARMVAGKFRELKFPLRWFSIPNCFRYERPQKGRTREFWQLNADIIGLEAGEADLEILLLLGKTFLEFGATKEMFSIRYGHRGLLDEWINKNNLNDKKEAVYALLDNWRKLVGDKKLAFATELNLTDVELGLISEMVENPDQIDTTSFAEIALIQKSLPIILPEVEFVFDPTIVRGIAYYTGLVFEAFDHNPENNRAMFGGGRYDNLMELFGQKSPAVGAAIGDLTWHEFLVGWNLYPENLGESTKVGILALNRDSLTEIFDKTIPKLISENKLYEVNYEYERSENKRYDALKKRGCGEVIKV
jgi:histidyl-tRNA synthetase